MSEKKNIMQRLHDTNILGRMQHHVNNHEFSYNIAGDDLIYFHSQLIVDDNWLHTKLSQGRLCNIWFKKYFTVHRVVPKKCFKHCYKAVACNRGFDEERQCYKQLSFDEVMQIRDLQLKLGLPSKCGMDDREYTPNVWGSYWYCDSLEEAENMFPTLREGLDKINPEISLSIKRSCTEMELWLGPTDTWDDIEPDWLEKEAILDRWLAQINPLFREEQHEMIEYNVREKLMYWAHKHGDLSYKQYIQGCNLIQVFPDVREMEIVPSVTYNR